MSQAKKDLLWVENIRTWAIFMVVLVHCSTDYVFLYPNDNMSIWWAANVYDSIGRWCVPNFIMISGFLLLGRELPLSVFFKKRFNKILLPTVAWSVFYVFWVVYVEQWEPSVWPKLKSMLYEPTFYHLWFLYTLIGLYLVLPLFSAFVRQERERPATIWYLVALWFIYVSVLPVLASSLNFRVGLELPGASGFVGFLLLGYLLGRQTYTAWDYRFAALTFVLAVGLIAYLTYRQTLLTGRVVETFYDNFSIPVIFASVAAFILIKGVSERLDFSHPKLAWSPKIGALSFGIYLIHPMWISLLALSPLQRAFNPEIIHPWFSIPVHTVLVFVLSCVSVWFMQRLPGVKKLVP